MSVEKNSVSEAGVFVDLSSSKGLNPALFAAIALSASACSDDKVPHHTHPSLHDHSHEDTGFSGDGGTDIDGDTDTDIDDDTGADDDIPSEVPDNMDSWPDSDELGFDFGGPIQDIDGTTFQFSGVVFDEATGFIYYVGNEGRIARMDLEGRNVSIWNVGGDLEAIALNQSDGTLWVGSESANGAFSFDYDSGLVLDACTFSDSPQEDRLGLEGMTHVPVEDAPVEWGVGAAGAFVVGSQADRMLRVYDAGECYGDRALTSLALIETSDKDVSGLHYSDWSKRLIVAHDGSSTLDLIRFDNPEDLNDEDGLIVRTDSFPDGGRDNIEQEGVTFLYPVLNDSSASYGDAMVPLVVANDEGFVNYFDYPISVRASVM